MLATLARTARRILVGRSPTPAELEQAERDIAERSRCEAHEVRTAAIKKRDKEGPTIVARIAALDQQIAEVRADADKRLMALQRERYELTSKLTALDNGADAPAGTLLRTTPNAIYAMLDWLAEVADETRRSGKTYYAEDWQDDKKKPGWFEKVKRNSSNKPAIAARLAAIRAVREQVEELRLVNLDDAMLQKRLDELQAQIPDVSTLDVMTEI